MKLSIHQLFHSILKLYLCYWSCNHNFYFLHFQVIKFQTKNMQYPKIDLLSISTIHILWLCMLSWVISLSRLVMKCWKSCLLLDVLHIENVVKIGSKLPNSCNPANTEELMTWCICQVEEGSTNCCEIMTLIAESWDRAPCWSFRLEKIGFDGPLLVKRRPDPTQIKAQHLCHLTLLFR